MAGSEEGSPGPVEVLLGPFDSHGTTRGLIDGRLFEIEHGIPDEMVMAEPVGRSRARIVDIIETADDRIEAPCPYFRDWACGGCQWQHIDYQGQLRRKREMVNDIMRDGGLPFTVRRVHALDDPWRYRATAGISLGRAAGFRRHGSLAIVPIRDCPISHPLIGALMAYLNDRLADGTLPDFRGRVRIDVRTADVDEETSLQVLIRGSDPKARPNAADVSTLARVLESAPGISGIATEAEDGSMEIVREPLYAPARIDDREVILSAASFFQSNPLLLTRLIDRLREEVGHRTDARLADVYGGVGIFGLFLADLVGHVTVVESDERAVEAGEMTARAWGLSNVEFLANQADHGLATEHFDIVVLDPPRAGLSGPVIESLVNAQPDQILYISCLPQSLARDLVDLGAAGYRLDTLELFDFYPQTYHTELLAVLRRDFASG